MTKTKSTFLALLAVVLSPMAANADPIVVTAPCEGGGPQKDYECAYGINGLDVSGELFDVEFIYFESYKEIFSSGRRPTFLGNPDGALAAAIAIAEALDALPPVPWPLGLAPIHLWNYIIPNNDPENSITDDNGFLVPSEKINTGDTDRIEGPGGWRTEDGWTSVEFAGGWLEDLPPVFGARAQNPYIFPFAVFTPSVTVPAPSTIALLSLGLLGLGLSRRKKV